MLAVISPAKTLDFETPAHTAHCSQPDFLNEASDLIEQLRPLTPAQLSQLMSLSDKLAALNVARYANWQLPFTPANAKQAVLAFKGDVYQGLDAATLNEEELAYAQQHLLILSGLYGLLRPLDLIQPYRLEMGTAFANSRGKDLYAFWGKRLTEALNQRLQQQEQQVLINLASNEYFKAIQPKQLQGRLITPVFKDRKNGQYKIISFYAKKARGLMCRYLIEQRPDRVEALQDFNYQGYYFSRQDSQGDTWTFLREEQDS
ncbi:peroxide stress protein YaaA [Balneatrix alpica]|uniref:UPF0246 protein ACFFLH_14780 n=1 Tax=Balneatrix alpica TaxID=75684 RepID=A0ABV5ZEH6_9GAMM|nr:peroxide stress protein YaaA [Balneatrix alpica]